MDNLIFISLVLVYRICNLSYKFQVVQFLHMSLSVFSGIALLERPVNKVQFSDCRVPAILPPYFGETTWTDPHFFMLNTNVADEIS